MTHIPDNQQMIKILRSYVPGKNVLANFMTGERKTMDAMEAVRLKWSANGQGLLVGTAGRAWLQSHLSIKAGINPAGTSFIQWADGSNFDSNVSVPRQEPIIDAGRRYDFKYERFNHAVQGEDDIVIRVKVCKPATPLGQARLY